MACVKINRLLLRSSPNLLNSLFLRFLTCSVQTSFSSSQAPRNLVLLVRGSVMPLSARFNPQMSVLLGQNTMYLDLLMFNVSLFALNQSCMIIRSLSMQYLRYRRFLWPIIKVVSSANCTHCKYRRFRWRSL